MKRRHPLRVPKTPHAPDDRLVPVKGCGCATCCERRDEAEAAHWSRVGDLMGIDEKAAE